MLQFTVPQFIDVEDKIIGPITTRQFIIMLFGFLLIFIAYKLFDFSLFLTFGIITFAVSTVIAFVKVNGMPFHFFIINFIQTLKRPALRVWNKNEGNSLAVAEDEYLPTAEPRAVQPIKTFSSSRLAELALIVDTKGAFRGNENNKKITISSKN